MRKLIMSSLFLMFFVSLPAPGYRTLYITEGESVKPYEALWKATCIVESNNNPLAIGDNHLKSKSYGIVQVRATRLNDYYNKTGIRYTEKDMFNPAKAKEVFMWYCSQVNPGNIEEISRSWNAGPNWKKVKASNKYFLKVKAML